MVFMSVLQILHTVFVTKITHFYGIIISAFLCGKTDLCSLKDSGLDSVLTKCVVTVF